MSALAGVAFGVVGLPVGSFLNVVVDRTPDRIPLRQVIEGEAHPPGSWGGVPVQPWVLAGGDPAGRPRRWLVVEVLTMAVFAAFGTRFGATSVGLTLLVLGAALVAVSAIDLEHLRIPDRVTFAALAIAGPAIVIVSFQRRLPGAVGGAIVGAIAYFLVLLVPHLAYPRGMGFGDVKLALLMGLYLGWLGWAPGNAVLGPVRLVLVRADDRLLRRRGLRAGPRGRHPPPRGVPLRPGPGPGLHRRRHLAAVGLLRSARTRSRRCAEWGRGLDSSVPEDRHRVVWSPRPSARLLRFWSSPSVGGSVAVSKERDPAATRAALAAWLRGRTGAAEVEVGEVTIPGLSGFSNETLLFDATWDDGDGPATHGLVVRVEPSGHTVFPSTEFDLQVQVLEALGAEGSVPVPEVLGFEQDTTVLGDRFLAMRKVEGEVPPGHPQLPPGGLVPLAHPRAPRPGVDQWDRHHGGHPPPRPPGHRPRPHRGPHARPSSWPSTASTGTSPRPTIRTPSSTRRSRCSRPPCRPPIPHPALCWGDSADRQHDLRRRRRRSPRSSTGRW